ENIVEIVDLFFKKLNAHLLDERGLTLEMDDLVKQWLVKEGFDPAYGARPLKRTMEKYIEDPLSEEILRGKFRDGGVVVVKREGDQLVFIDKKDLVTSNT
ncbi:MAG TPA: ATP-dependent Clp protease ATP-binding subunit ClpC, partial [Nitrospinota bacterium]|nr:ATP-dependent Clp protease ATP-binding subunit ClpC [Nitrospinota bacterium]